MGVSTAEAPTTDGEWEMTDHITPLTNSQVPVQRLRVWFAKGDALKYISHLDLTRTWERIFRRAMLPVAHSQGFNPRPRFQIAAALPVGVTGGAELLDLWLTESWKPEDVLLRLRATVPDGMQALAVEEVDLRSPSLQSQVCAADYRAVVHSEERVEGIRTRVRALLDAPTLLRQRHHKGKVQSYDLRPLIQAIDVEAAGGASVLLTMRLQANPQGAGRPDEVLDALGLALFPHTLERTNLYFEFDK
jgi:radical SAM-linked protein